MFGAEIDFSDYDAKPPKVNLVHPLTGQPLSKATLPPLVLGNRVLFLPTFERSGDQLVQKGDLFQEWAGTGKPFVCLRGVRQYHENPGHSGDSWWLHRGSGAGSLAYLLNQLIILGTRPVDVPYYQIKLLGTSVSPERLEYERS